MKKSRGVLSLVVTAVLIVLLGYTTIFGFGAGATGSAKNIKLGLDLAGGVSITYQVKEDNPSSEDMADTIYKLQRRVEEYSTEAQVYQEGDDRINIEIFLQIGDKSGKKNRFLVFPFDNALPVNPDSLSAAVFNTVVDAVVLFFQSENFVDVVSVIFAIRFDN